MEFLLFLSALIFAHLLADYPLQGDFLALNKGKNLIALIAHAGIWTGCISVTIILLGFNINIVDIMSLFIIHSIADYAKANSLLVYKKLDNLKGGLVLDQSIHLIQIIVILSYKMFL